MLLGKMEDLWGNYKKEDYKNKKYFSEVEQKIIEINNKKMLIENPWIIGSGIIVFLVLMKLKITYTTIIDMYAVDLFRNIGIGVVVVIGIISFIQDLINREKALKLVKDTKKGKSIFNSCYLKMFKIVIIISYLIGGICLWAGETGKYVGAMGGNMESSRAWVLFGNILVIIYLLGNNIYYFIINKLIVSTIPNLAKAIKRGGLCDVKKSIKVEGGMNSFLGDNYAIIFREIEILIDKIEKISKDETNTSIDKIEVITNASHDIKTPITSIKNYIYILENKKLTNKEKSECVDILKDKVRNLNYLLENLKTATDILSFDINVNLEMIDIKKIINEVLEEYNNELGSKGINVVINSHDDKKIKGDKKFNKTIFRNIFSNINKYSLENSEVFINIMDLEQRDIIIEIENSTKEKLDVKPEELLKRFKRGDASRNTEGNGLGLDIVKNLVQLQGGEFSIYINKENFMSKIKYKMENKG